jgi:methylenetetrahydrofolate--tRNA-(uracil-5-)-methyltransferase
MHRNTFLDSPRVLDGQLRLKAVPRLRFAGQITGVEGYVESAAMGLVAGRLAAAELLGRAAVPPPPTTAVGALLNHITGGHVATIESGAKSFQPMNANFGLFPPISDPTHDAEGKRIKGKDKTVTRKRALADRALADLDAWLAATVVDKAA